MPVSDATPKRAPGLAYRFLHPRLGPPARRRVADRRDGVSRFHLPEQRTGFDRRSARGGLHYLRRRPDALLVMLIVLNLMSALDWLCTTTALSHGATEANAVVAGLICVHPLAAGIFKVCVTGAVSIGIWLGRRHRRVLATGRVAVMTYGLLLAYEVVGLIAIGVL